ncbi:MAG: hypothetical protein AABX54_03960 [Nanoarchaeota archaeon]
MKNINLLAIILLLFFFQSIILSNSQMTIHTPIGVPKILSVEANPIPRSGASLIINVKNIGNERGGFYAYAECNKGFKVNENWNGNLESSEEKQITINVFGEGMCSETITCNVIFEDSINNKKSEHSISFTNDCSLCGTDSAICKKDDLSCTGGKIERCNNYCIGYDIVQTCNEGCLYKDKWICKEDANWIDKVDWSLWTFLIFITLMIILFIYLIYHYYHLKKK